MATLSPCYPFLHPPSYPFPKLSSSFPCPLSVRPWSSKDASFRVSATGKSRSGSKKAKSNADLLTEIREFLTSVGLPHDHVPSTKELSQNGRQDLANIVRRRGYKFVKELLANGTEESEESRILHEKATKFIQFGVLDGYDVRDAEVINGSISSPTYDVEDRVSETPLRIENALTEEARTMDIKEDLDMKVEEEVNQEEIDRMKLLLHQRGLELIELKKQIEREQLALAAFQSKAQKEINEVQKLIAEKDAELHAAEESLSGLEEVEIQFWGDGEVVEVAGSFNGWHQMIKLEPQPPSSVSDGSQKSRHWKTLIWLYPGVYEMKFIVDGHWTVDPEKETVTRGSIHNNILRVGGE